MTELSKNAILFMPEGSTPPLGVIQIIHGMAEYQGRYKVFAQYLVRNGYAVVTSDLKGHGNHISGNTELGFFGDNAVSRLVGDIHENTLYIKDHFPRVPYIILGHGIGALLATIYLKKYDNFIDGLFLSGMPADRPLRPAAPFLVRLLILLKGEYHRSKLMNSLVLGPCSVPYQRKGSSFSWLSSDTESVMKYISDPKCGYIYTLNGFDTILDMMNQTYTKGSWIKKHPACPIRLFCGADDTCQISEAAVSRIVYLFSSNGYTNVTSLTYPGQRHELFQDSERFPMFEDFLKELEAIQKKEEPAQTKNRPVHIVLEDFIDPEVEKPFVAEEKINLEDFINIHSDEAPGQRARVEMIDMNSIEDPQGSDK